MEGEKLESFSDIGNLISGGAVLGYGTEEGGKMVSSGYSNQPQSEYYYVYYYDENYQKRDAISKLDEKNLEKLSEDLEVDYIHMDKKSNIDYKLEEIKEQAEDSENNEEKVKTYKDIYYYFAIPLAIVLIVDFVLKRRRM